MSITSLFRKPPVERDYVPPPLEPHERVPLGFDDSDLPPAAAQPPTAPVLDWERRKQLERAESWQQAVILQKAHPEPPPPGFVDLTSEPEAPKEPEAPIEPTAPIEPEAPTSPTAPWQTTPPAVAGLWWYRAPGDQVARLVVVLDFGERLCVRTRPRRGDSCVWHSISVLPWIWAGPVATPVGLALEDIDP